MGKGKWPVIRFRPIQFNTVQHVIFVTWKFRFFFTLQTTSSHEIFIYFLIFLLCLVRGTYSKVWSMATMSIKLDIKLLTINFPGHYIVMWTQHNIWPWVSLVQVEQVWIRWMTPGHSIVRYISYGITYIGPLVSIVLVEQIWIWWMAPGYWIDRYISFEIIYDPIQFEKVK